MNGRTVAVVTGAGRGIGREIARRLADRGHLVVATDLDESTAVETAALVGRDAVGMAHDVREPEGHRAVARRAAELGRLAVWVNNAGVLWVGGAFAQPDDHVALTVEVNLLGAMHGSRAAVEAMRSHHGQPGDVVNIASISAFPPTPGLACYAATKAGVVSWTTSLHAELRGERSPIRVHAVCPATVATGMASDNWHKEASAFQHVQPRLLEPGEVADAVAAVIGSRKVVTSVAPRRDVIVLAHLGGLAPRGMSPLLPVVSWMGNRRRSRRQAG